MKHRLTIPYLNEADYPADVDIAEWAYTHGWRVEHHEWQNHGYRGALARHGRMLQRVTLVPRRGAFPDSSVRITAASGAVLVYDDEDGTMGVHLDTGERRR